MKNKVTIKVLIGFLAFFCFNVKAQIHISFDSLAGFDAQDGEEHAKRLGKTGADKTWFINQAKRNYVDRKYHLDKPALPGLTKGTPPAPTALNCATDNYNFEQGNTSGWTLSGTCGLVSSPTTDPYGGFPWICPFGGSNTLRLSNDASNGCCTSSATKSIPVPAVGTTFFTFYFALAIFGYPHTAAQAATFSVDFYDASGTLIPCPQFLCYHSTDNGDVGVSNFSTTSQPASFYNPSSVGDSPGTYNVVTCPWQTVSADLTPYAGTTITAVFTVKWCVYNVDWLYALIDTDCPLNYIPPTSSCVNIPSNICGPPNMQTYNWNTPTGGTGTGSCISATTAGIYTCVCSPDLTCGSPSFTYTYNVAPIPTAAFTSSLPPCSSNLTVTDNSTLHGATVSSYSWSFGDATTGTGSPATHTYPGTPGSYNVTETITTTQGCTATVTNPVSVTNPIAITVNSGTICGGGSAALTASGGATTYSWSPGTGLSTTSGPNVTANPASTTVYTITGSNGTCSNTATSTVTVNAIPVVTVASPTVCNGTAGTMTASGAATYTWNTGATGATLTQTPGATTNYTVTGASAGGCTSTGTGAINVNPLPTVTIASTSVCPGTAGTMTASGASTYTWNTGANGATLTQTPASTTSYTVVGTDVNGCVNTGFGSITVGGSISPTVNNATICTGNSATLTAGGATTYTWSPGTGLSATTGASVIANPTVTTTYTISGSVGTCSGTVNSLVTVNPLPTVTVNSGTICVTQQTATLTASGAGAGSYSWTPATGLSATTGASVMASPATTTPYTVTATDANGCVNTNTTAVTANPLPTVTVNSATVCPTFSATLTAGGASTYTWNTGAVSPSITDAPAATTSYTVIATDLNGCVSGNTATITVNPNLFVTAANNSAICDGATLNLTTPVGVVWSWAGPGGYTSTSQNPSIPNATPAMSGTYSVTAIDANGCQGSAVTTVTVNTLPIVTVTSGTICIGQQTTTLTASGAGAGSYNWTPATGLSATGGASVVANPATSTPYTVTATDGNGCVNSNTTAVTVNPLPTVTVNSSTICVTQQTATLTAVGSSTSYIWSPSTSLSSSTGASVTGTPSVTTNYLITGTDANGCVNTGTASILVNPLPLVPVSGNTVCVNGTVILTGPGGMAAYSWSGPGSFISSIQSPTIAPAITGNTGAYALTVTDMNGCVSGNVAMVTVNPLPPVTASSATICTGNLGTLVAGGANTYIWSPTTGLITANSATVATNAIATTAYTVTGTDVNGCVSTATSTVTVNPLPVLAVTPPTSSGCAPVCVTFANTTSASGSCAWVFGDGTTSASCNPTHCFTGKGTFGAVLTMTDNNGCVNTATATVVVYPMPIADFNATPQPTSIYDPHIYFTDASTGAVVNTWAWTLGDPNNTTSTIPNPNITYLEPGSYPVHLVVTTAFGCKDSTTKIIVIADEYSIYVPNAFSPNGDGVNDMFFAKGEGIKDFKLYVFDRWGNQIFYSDDIYKGWDGRYQSKGTEIVQEDVYVWKIECKTVTGERKMLKGIVSLIK